MAEKGGEEGEGGRKGKKEREEGKGLWKEKEEADPSQRRPPHSFSPLPGNYSNERALVGWTFAAPLAGR